MTTTAKTKPAGLLGLARQGRRQRALNPEGTAARKSAARRLLLSWARVVVLLEAADGELAAMGEAAEEIGTGLPVFAPLDLGQLRIDATCELDVVGSVARCALTVLGEEATP